MVRPARNPRPLLEAGRRGIALAVSGRTDPEGVDAQVERLAAVLRGRPDRGEEGAQVFATFADLGTPAARRASYALLRDATLPLPHRHYLLLSLDGQTMPATDLGPLLADLGWQRELSDQYFYASFLEEAARRPDGANREAVRDRLLEATASIGGREDDDPAQVRGSLLQGLKHALGESDAALLEPLLARAEAGSTLERAAIRLAAQVRPSPALQARLEAALSDPDLALPAAQSLGRLAHPLSRRSVATTRIPRSPPRSRTARAESPDRHPVRHGGRLSTRIAGEPGSSSPVFDRPSGKGENASVERGMTNEFTAVVERDGE